MTEAPADEARRALHVLADLSSSSEGRTGVGSIPLDWFTWLPTSGVSILADGAPAGLTARGDGLGDIAGQVLAGPPTTRGIAIDRHLGDRLAAVDQLRPGQRPLRIGWLFVAGKVTTTDGRTRHCFLPLISRPARVVRALSFGSAYLEPAGDVELTALITDRDLRIELEHRIETGGGALYATTGVEVSQDLLERLARLRSFAVDAAEAAGFSVTDVIPAGDSPERLRRAAHPVVVAGLAVFANQETGGLSHAASLRTWAGRSLGSWTAFHSCYSSSPAPTWTSSARPPVDSPFLLTPVQRAAVERSRTQSLTVVRGAPGTGKSHTVVAIACDALSRNETVLVAAKSDATVDALIDLFERAPGPRPVVFGSNERKEALAAHLANGLTTSGAESVDRSARELAAARAHRDRVRQSIGERLELELARPPADVVELARARWPAMFDPAFDLDAGLRLRAEATAPDTGWWSRRRHRKAMAALATRAGAPAGFDPRELVATLDLVAATRRASAFVAAGGLQIGDDWTTLQQADDHVRSLTATWLDLDSRSARRLVRTTMAAVASLATALRSGRASRREQLSRMDERVTTVLPLWAGTLSDIDDLLPGREGLFDLVILDEASSIDQPTAAAALLRGKRGVVVGDPQQLRHVSFISDEQRDVVLATSGIGVGTDLAARLDVRRNSAFDVAAAAAPVLTLDEHFRCRPHLVEFVSRELYAGGVQVATRSPATESVDCIDLERLSGTRDDAGVVAAEVDAVIGHLRHLHALGETSVGVVTPFRAQADAIEHAILEMLTADQIHGLDLRVGTVHAFQGNERDVVLASIGIGAESEPASWRFVEDPHLFTVLVTRARERFIIIRSADPPRGGLAARYLAQADAPPGTPRPEPCFDGWTTAVDQHLTAAGLRTISTYPTGRHQVDICVTTPEGFFGVECSVHPDGPAAHIDRHLSLTHRDWPLREAYESRWGDRRGELIVELTQREG